MRKLAELGEQQWLQYAGLLMDQLLDRIVEFNGSFSVGHGIGSDKCVLLAGFASGSRLEGIKLIKQAIHAKGLMHPGEVFL